MQTLQKHILKSKEIFVGLEDSKLTWKICVRSNKMIVHETRMPATYDVLKAYFENCFPDCKINLIYEAGFRGFSLYDQLVNDGVSCVVTPPHTVTEEKNNKVKTDKRDAKRLSKNLENNDYKACFIPSKQQRYNRQIARTLGQVQRKIKSTKNQIRRFLEFHGLDKYFKSGAWSEKDYRNLSSIFSSLTLPLGLNKSLGMLLKILEQLNENKNILLKDLQVLRNSEEYKKSVDLLKSVPGIGSLTAIRLILEWGNVERFKSQKHFASFLGLTPGEYSSGEVVKRGHITGQGNKWTRSWLIEAAWFALKKDCALLNKFTSVFSRSGSKKKAIVATARKLALRLRTILLNETPYQIGVLI